MQRTMTPKLRLSEQARKTLLSSMRKLRLPGNRRTMLSTHMMAAPKTHAGRHSQYHSSGPAGRRAARDSPMPLTMHIIHPRVSLSRPLVAKSMASVSLRDHSVEGEAWYRSIRVESSSAWSRCVVWRRESLGAGVRWWDAAGGQLGADVLEVWYYRVGPTNCKQPSKRAATSGLVRFTAKRWSKRKQF